MGWIPEPGQGGGGGGGNAAYAETVGDGNTTSFDITHGLGSSDVAVEVIELSSGDALVHGTDYMWLILDEDEIRVVFSSAPGVDDARVVVLAAGGEGGGGGGETLIAEEAIGSSVATFTVNDIPAGYRDLRVVAEVITADQDAHDFPRIRLGDGTADSGTNYAYAYEYRGTADNAHKNNSVGFIQNGPVAVGAGDATPNVAGYAEWLIRDYAAAKWKAVSMWGIKSGSSYFQAMGAGMWRSTAAVDLVQFSADGGNITSGTVRVYGIS